MLHIVLSFESLSPIDRLLALEVAVKVKLNVDFWISYLLDYLGLDKTIFLWWYVG